MISIAIEQIFLGKKYFLFSIKDFFPKLLGFVCTW